MDQIFDWCVEFLEFYAKRFGTTYKSLNVWIFCIIEPIIFFVLLFIIVNQARKLHKLKKLLELKK